MTVRVLKNCLNGDHPRVRRIVTALVMWVGLLCNGCGIPRSVVWLPDSSGLIYVTDEGGLARVDISSDRQNVARHYQILKDAGPHGMIPAVNLKQDPSEFAIVTVVSRTDVDTVHVRVHDLDGTELPRRSKSWDWETDNGRFKGVKERKTAAIWSRDGDHILFWYESVQDRSFKFGQFNVNEKIPAKQFRKLEGTVPLVDLWHFGLSPIRADGSGYLAVRGASQGLSNLYFVDWDGWARPLRATEELRLFEDRTEINNRLPVEPILEQMLANQQSRLRQMRLGQPHIGFPNFSRKPRIPHLPRNPFTVPTETDGNFQPSQIQQRLPVGTPGWRRRDKSMIVFSGAGRIVLDPDRQQASFDTYEQLQESRPHLTDDRVLQWMPIGRGQFVVQTRLEVTDRQSRPVVEIAKPWKDGNRSKRLGVVAVGKSYFTPLMPSPDGKHIAATYDDGSGRIMTSIVDEEGKIMATFQISGRNWSKTLTSRPAKMPNRIDDTTAHSVEKSRTNKIALLPVSD